MAAPFPLDGRTRAAAPVFLLLLGALAAGGLVASDHKDGPVTTDNPAIDIADVYAFRSPTDPGSLVLVMNVHGFIPPAEAGSVSFDPGLLYELKLDTDGDAVEDRVIQARVTGSGADQRIHFRGPLAPVTAGTSSRLLPGGDVVSVPFTSTGDARTASGGGLTVFAGVRDDPFFFDFARYQQIVAGKADSFRQPGMDTFAGTNVLALAVEVPLSALGGGPKLGLWGTVSRPAGSQRVAVRKDTGREGAGLVYQQVDRHGIPGNAVVFIPKPQTPEYNRAAPAGDTRRYRDEVVAKLVEFGQPRAEAAKIADMVLPDILTIDTSRPTQYPNGRAPADDVITANLMTIFDQNQKLNDDHVDSNDRPFLDTFPFLAPPHTR
ncbi:MAG TPA: DUF4331 family protein [Longimicrobiaceae bacterium]|nr:DUF4331 family protein [Longimicrobiaceae bacterium]